MGSDVGDDDGDATTVGTVISVDVDAAGSVIAGSVGVSVGPGRLTDAEADPSTGPALTDALPEIVTPGCVVDASEGSVDALDVVATPVDSVGNSDEIAEDVGLVELLAGDVDEVLTASEVAVEAGAVDDEFVVD